MLKKLLKYDFKALFKFWWIAVLINLLLSVFGGFVQLIENYNEMLAQALYDLLGLSLFMVNCSYVALVLVTLVLIFIRFYQNFFTDEGYLTFTLPVSRSQLLNSKVISGIGTLLASVAVCGVNLIIKNTIAWWPELVNGTAFREDSAYIAEEMNTMGAYFWIYSLEALLLVVVLVILAVMILYFCITFGSMIVKKGKLILSIVLCYLITNVISTIGVFSMIFWAFGFNLLFSFEAASDKDPITALILLGLIFYGGMLSGLLYSLIYRMLDKKLNLS